MLSSARLHTSRDSEMATELIIVWSTRARLGSFLSSDASAVFSKHCNLNARLLKSHTAWAKWATSRSERPRDAPSYCYDAEVRSAISNSCRMPRMRLHVQHCHIHRTSAPFYIVLMPWWVCLRVKAPLGPTLPHYAHTHTYQLYPFLANTL